MDFSELNQDQAKRLKDKKIVALLPLGAVEVHGDHIPLGTDMFLAEALAKRVEENLGAEKAALLPVIPYGQAWSLLNVPGTISVSNDVLSGMLIQIGEGLYQSGIKKMAIINTHVGNVEAMKMAARALYEKIPLKVYYFTYPGAEGMIKRVCTSPLPHRGYFHACEIETSYMLHLCPEKVHMSKAVCQHPDFPEEFDYTPTPWQCIMDKAVLGDALAATAEKGELILAHVVDRIVGILQESDGMAKRLS